MFEIIFSCQREDESHSRREKAEKNGLIKKSPALSPTLWSNPSETGSEVSFEHFPNNLEVDPGKSSSEVPEK